MQLMLRPIPALCSAFIALLLTVLRPQQAGDFTLGVVTGVLLGLSLLSLLRL